MSMDGWLVMDRAGAAIKKIDGGLAAATNYGRVKSEMQLLWRNVW